jgi:hypothetical protein
VTNRDTDGPTIETANEVRQGPKGKPMLYVLLVGLGLALLALLYFTSTSVEDPPGPGTDSVPGSSEPAPTAPPPAAP